MQQVSELYQRLIAEPNHWFETRLEIGEPGVLITEAAEPITFGNEAARILVASSGPEAGFSEAELYDLSITRKLFSNNVPEVGCCVAAEIDFRMRKTIATIPRMARLVPWVRVVSGDEVSEWIQKGIFYIDTRDYTQNTDNVIATVHGYDGMLKAEQSFPSTSGIDWPLKDWQVVEIIAGVMGVFIDPRTWEIMTGHGNTSAGYDVQIPTIYTCREILGFIGAMYAGNWVMNDFGQLRLIGINEMPEDTNYLTDHVGYAITFLDDGNVYDDEGVVRILV